MYRVKVLCRVDGEVVIGGVLRGDVGSALVGYGEVVRMVDL